MKSHQFKAVVESVLQFTKERNSPKETAALRALWQIADEYLVGTTAAKQEVMEKADEQD